MHLPFLNIQSVAILSLLGHLTNVSPLNRLAEFVGWVYCLGERKFSWWRTVQQKTGLDLLIHCKTLMYLIKQS